MRAQVTISDSELCKATGKTWQQWSEIVVDAPEDAALFLRQNYGMNAWWSQAVATAFRKPIPRQLRMLAQPSLNQLIRACNQNQRPPVNPKPVGKKVTTRLWEL